MAHDPSGAPTVGGIAALRQPPGIVVGHREEPRGIPSCGIPEYSALEPAVPGAGPPPENAVAKPGGRMVAPPLASLEPSAGQPAPIAAGRPGAKPAVTIAKARPADGTSRSGGGPGRRHLDHAPERKVAVERARGAADDPEPVGHSGEEDVPVGVAFDVPVERQIDRHPVDDQQQVGRVIRAESPEDRVGREPGPLPLLVDLDPRQPPDQIPRILGLRFSERGRVHHLGGHRRGDRPLPNAFDRQSREVTGLGRIGRLRQEPAAATERQDHDPTPNRHRLTSQP